MHLERRVLVSGGADFWARICASSSLRGDSKSFASTTSSPGRGAISSICSITNVSSSCATTSLIRCLSRWTKSSISHARPRPIHYQKDPVQTTKTSVDRRDQHARAGQAPQDQGPAGFDERSLRRPHGAPAAGNLLGQRQSDRTALLLRRGQTLRRDAVLRLSAAAPPADQGRPHLQYLRPANASQ